MFMGCHLSPKVFIPRQSWETWPENLTFIGLFGPQNLNVSHLGQKCVQFRTPCHPSPEHLLEIVQYIEERPDHGWRRGYMTPPLPEYPDREIPELKLNVELNIQIIRSYLRLRHGRSLESYFQKEKKRPFHAMPRNRNRSTNFTGLGS
jgi:hypothetical protein